MLVGGLDALRTSYRGGVGMEKDFVGSYRLIDCD